MKLYSLSIKCISDVNLLVEINMELIYIDDYYGSFIIINF